MTYWLYLLFEMLQLEGYCVIDNNNFYTSTVVIRGNP
jgi:hypothetical protein